VLRLCVIDDHALLGQTLVSSFREAGVDAWMLPPTGREELLAALAEDRPDVVLLDLDLGDPIGDGTLLVAPLQSLGAKVLVMTGVRERLRLCAAIAAGADGILAKTVPFEELLAAARQLVEGGTLISEAIRLEVCTEVRRHRRHEEASRKVFRQLTVREREVLNRLAEGRPVSAIAEEFVVSEATVRSQVRGILTKLGVGSQLEAVALANRSGWIPQQRSG
jgi:DNA-binding NarL/FixJ family response regulator